MKQSIERIINELQHDSKVQAMHRDNIAKRQALRERRRALMLARHQVAEVHLPMAWDSVEAVAGDENEWLHLRCVEAIRRIEAKGYNWVEYLVERGLLPYGDEWEELLAAHSEAHHNFYFDKPREAYADHTEVDGVVVLHPNTFLEWLDLGQHWHDEEMQQRLERLERFKRSDADGIDWASKIESTLQLVAEAQAAYDKATQLFEEEEERYTLSDGSVTTDFLAWAKDKVAANKAARHAA